MRNSQRNMRYDIPSNIEGFSIKRGVTNGYLQIYFMDEEAFLIPASDYKELDNKCIEYRSSLRDKKIKDILE